MTIRKPNLGKLLPIGSTFHAATKRMDKNRHGQSKLNKELNGPLITYEVLRTGDKKYFTKGKRKYYCVVLGLIETRTGLYTWETYHSEHFIKFKAYLRWWQFTYLVKILEN